MLTNPEEGRRVTAPQPFFFASVFVLLCYESKRISPTSPNPEQGRQIPGLFFASAFVLLY
jgi:hypothetical protein